MPIYDRRTNTVYWDEVNVGWLPYVHTMYNNLFELNYIGYRESNLTKDEVLSRYKKAFTLKSYSSFPISVFEISRNNFILKGRLGESFGSSVSSKLTSIIFPYLESVVLSGQKSFDALLGDTSPLVVLREVEKGQYTTLQKLYNFSIIHKGKLYKNLIELSKELGLSTWELKKHIVDRVLPDDFQKHMQSPKTPTPVVDHLGNEFASKKEMLDHWGISGRIFDGRMGLGWSLERALTTPKIGGFVVDHLGNKYKNNEEMAKHYGLTLKSLANRLYRGWDLELALTHPLGKPSVFKVHDHLGNEYLTLKEMLNHYDVHPDTYRRKLKAGVSLKDILEAGKTTYEVSDHLGNVFTNKREMATHYGLTLSALMGRLKDGWDLEKALTKPQRGTDVPVKDHKGVTFESLEKMLDHYGLVKTAYKERLQKGWSLERVLTTPYKKLGQSCVDHLGNEFPNTKTMCDYYGVKWGTYRSKIARGASVWEALGQPSYDEPNKSTTEK